MIDLLVANSWLAAILWASLYVCDHVLTRFAAKVYQALPQERRVISSQGGMELNPSVEQEVKRSQWFSRRFIFMLFLTVSMILLVGLVNEKALFEVLTGAFILEWVSVNLIHFQNLLTFRDLNKPNSAIGRIEYSYWLSQRTLTYYLLSFVILYLFIALATLRLFFVGGVISCSILALRQFSLANRKFPAPVDTTDDTIASTKS